MKAKLIKALKIGGGLFVLSEFFGTLGEVQALGAMHILYPDEVEGIVDGLKNAEDYSKNPYKILKCKIIGHITQASIENES